MKKLQTEFPEIIKDVHGLGLLIGIDFATNEVGYAVAAGLFHRHVLVAGTLISAKTIRMEPALNIPMELLKKVLDRMHDTLKDVRRKYVRHGKLVSSTEMEEKLG